MRIAVCDDEIRYLDEVQSMLAEFALQTDSVIHADTFHSPCEVLKQERYDLYLLDYSMPRINGVELAVALKEKFGESVAFCYFTTYETAAVDVINRNIHAEAFLVKPIQKTELFQVLNRLYSQSAANRIVLKRDKGFVTVFVQDILYAEASNKETLLHMTKSKESFPVMFTDMLERYLPQRNFYKVHRSYAVNLARVSGYTKNSVIMDNGDSIPCSKIKEFREALDRFHFNSF